MGQLDSINQIWGVRHIITLLAQCIQLAVGISLLIHELNNCSTSDTPLHECESITLWQHVALAVVILNIILDFYGMCFCDINMLTHIQLLDDVTIKH